MKHGYQKLCSATLIKGNGFPFINYVLTWSLTTGKRLKRQFHKTAPTVNVSSNSSCKQLRETEETLLPYIAYVFEWPTFFKSIKIFGRFL